MHFDPKCPYGHEARKACISQSCGVSNPFICNQCDKDRHSSSCEIISYRKLIKQFHKAQGIYTQQMLNYQERVEKLFQSMIKRLKAEFLQFREQYECHQIIPQVQEIYAKLKQGEQNQLNATYFAPLIGRKYFGGKPVIRDQMAMFMKKRTVERMFEEMIKQLRLYYSVEINLDYEDGPSLQYSQNPLKHIMRKYVKPRKQVEGLFNPYFRYFEQLLAEPIYNLQLLYRASEHQFDSNVFHEQCDGITNTVTIAKTEHDKVVMGYCSLAWESPEQWTYRTDHKKECFLISAHEYFQRSKFTLFKTKFAIGMHKDYGPAFGDDFVIYNKSNHSKNCWSNFPDVYTCKQKQFPHNSQTIIQFVGVQDHFKKFNIKEWEVYKVSYGPDDEVQSKQMKEYRKIEY